MAIDASDPSDHLPASTDQLDLFQDSPEGQLHLLLATLEQEANRAVACGHLSEVIRGLSALLAELGEAEEPHGRLPIPEEHRHTVAPAPPRAGRPSAPAGPAGADSADAALRRERTVIQQP